MKVLAVVPARAGSKRIRNKNLRQLGGKPLLAWTIAAAIESGVCDEIVVSTDGEDIANAAVAAGAAVHGLRPAELSGDEATSVAVAEYELDRAACRGHRPDALLWLQPTSPFRRPQTIRDAVELFARHGGRRRVVSVSPSPVHPSWCYLPDGDLLRPAMKDEPLEAHSQDLLPAYVLNGAVYLASPEQLLREASFLGDGFVPVVMESARESIDIDTSDDWRLAERFAETALQADS